MFSWKNVFLAFPGVLTADAYDRLRPQRFEKARAADFDSWWKARPDSVRRLVSPCKGDPRWGKIQVLFPSKDPNIASLSFYHVICLDPKSSHAGNIYYDEGKAWIYFKLFISALWRPLHLVAKTIYHLSLVGVARGIAKGVRRHESKEEIAKRAVRSLLDIVRTPVYETALIIIGLVAPLIAPFKSTLLYDFRALTGELSHELYWGKRYPWCKKGPCDGFLVDLTPCMRRLINIQDIEKTKNYKKIAASIDSKDRDPALLMGEVLSYKG